MTRGAGCDLTPITCGSLALARPAIGLTYGAWCDEVPAAVLEL